MSHSTFRKRQREQTQRERRVEKEARRSQHKREAPLQDGSQPQEDPDPAGMVPGPHHPHEE